MVGYSPSKPPISRSNTHPSRRGVAAGQWSLLPAGENHHAVETVPPQLEAARLWSIPFVHFRCSFFLGRTP
jgi:hypothetical protein